MIWWDFGVFFLFLLEELSERGMAFLPQQLRLLSPLPSIQPCAASVSADGLRRAMSYAGVFSMGMGERYKQRERGRLKSPIVGGTGMFQSFYILICRLVCLVSIFVLYLSIEFMASLII